MTGPFYVPISKAKPHLEPWHNILYLVHHFCTQDSSSSSVDSASVDLVVVIVILCICLLFFWYTAGVHLWDSSLEKANLSTSSLISNPTFSYTVKSGSVPTCLSFWGSSRSAGKSCSWPTSGWALSAIPAFYQLWGAGLPSKFGVRDGFSVVEQLRESMCGYAGCFHCLLHRFLGTGLADEVGQNSDMDNPVCDSLIVRWAVLNISLCSWSCTQSVSGMPTSLRPAK